MIETGTLHLIPVSLGDSSPSIWQPPALSELVHQLTIYIAENAKTARAFLKQSGTAAALQDITIHTLKNDTTRHEISQWLEPLAQGSQIGLLSEAGCPAVADPGAQVVAITHEKGWRVTPWVGPSSILLALMASGLDGQRFTFHGYIPIKPGERTSALKQWEAESRQRHQTQIFIETPYRNQTLFTDLLGTLKPSTRLCIGCNLNSTSESIATHTVQTWKQQAAPDLHKKPCIFLFLA